eukprot:2140798-Rhodomonas_salina.1
MGGGVRHGVRWEGAGAVPGVTRGGRRGTGAAAGAAHGGHDRPLRLRLPRNVQPHRHDQGLIRHGPCAIWY